MAEDGVESESQHGAQAQEEAYVRLGAQIVFGICLPFLLIALTKLCVWIVFSPFWFFGFWAIGLIIGLVANAVIEFDFHHGYPNAVPRQISGASGRIIFEVEPAPPTEEVVPNQEPIEPEFLDVNEPPPIVQDFGLVGQGESQVDQVPPPRSSNTSARSRPLKLRRSVNVGRNDSSLDGVGRVGLRPRSSLPEIPEEDSSDSFILSAFPPTEPESSAGMTFPRSTSSSDEDDIVKYIVSEQED